MKVKFTLEISMDAFLLCQLCNIDMEKLIQYYANHIDVRNGENNPDEHIEWASYFFVVYINKTVIEPANKIKTAKKPDKKS